MVQPLHQIRVVVKTVSTGWAIFDPEILVDPSRASVADRADKVLYAAKRSGRDRIRVWEPGSIETTAPAQAREPP